MEEIRYLTMKLEAVPILEILSQSQLESRSALDVGLGDSNGFYDYLRSDPRTIVGVRWTPFPEAEFILDALPASSSLQLVPNGVLRSLLIWFRGQMKFDAEISDDQRFVYNRIFRYPNDDLLVTFGTAFLTPEEFESLAGSLERQM